MANNDDIGLDKSMIKLTRINKVDKFWLNEDKIEFLEETPDTIVSLESGKKISVSETADEVVRLIIHDKREIYGRYDEPIL
jgi:flagellar protein FlbD